MTKVLNEKSSTLIFILSAVLTTAGCNRPVRPANNASVQATTNPSAAIYPHSAEFVTTKMHGLLSAKDSSTCKTCHGADLMGGTSKKACNTCHTTYPHGDGFKKSPEHGKLFLADSSQCFKCHKAGQEPQSPHSQSQQAQSQQAQPATGPTDCRSCHSFPHESQFSHPDKHGARFLKDPATCKTCHGEKLDGGIAEVSCTQCHKQYPHSDEFKKTKHGSEFLADRTACLKCHQNKSQSADEAKNSKAPPQCQTCHTYPHDQASSETAWHRPESHGDAYVKAADKTACLKCHAEDSQFKKDHPKEFVSCGSCHAIMPHPKTDDFYDHAAEARAYGVKMAAPDAKDSKDKAATPQLRGSYCTACHYDLKRFIKDATGCAGCHPDGQPQVKWLPPPSPQ